MRTALYVRVSSEAQAEHGYSLEAQLEKLKGYCKLNDIYEYDEYIDGGYTGFNLDRPELQRLFRDIEARKIDRVIIYKLDRLSRRTKDTLHIVEDIFRKFDVKLVSLFESIDTASPSGFFFLSILSSVAQLERDTIRERVQLGKKAKASKGIKSKTPNILIGYTYNDSTKQFEINDHNATQVRLIFQKFIDGESMVQIAKFVANNFYGGLKQPIGNYVRQIWRILENESYTGKMRINGQIMAANNIPAIIDMETFLQAQELVKTRKKTQTRVHSTHLLTGLMFCGLCGARIRTHFQNKKRYRNYYICYSRGNNNPNMVKDKNCTLPYFKYDGLNETILNSVKKVCGSRTYFDKVKRKIVDYDGQRKLIENELKKLADRANKIVDLIIDGTIDKETLTQRLNAINQQKESLQEQLKAVELEQSKETALNYTQAKEYANELAEAPPERKRNILKRLIQKIVLYDNNRVEVFWNF